MRRPLACLLAALAPVLAACGDDDGRTAAAPERVVLALDFTPNAVHAPLYAAVREGLDRRSGVRLQVRAPGQGPDGLKLVASGRADLALLDVQDLAIAGRRGADVVAVGALVGRPLGALVAQPSVRRPRELEGRRVGVSGLPSDPAFVDAIVRADGGDPSRVRSVTIGFAGVSQILSRKVDAIPAFWNAEGVALRERGRAVSVFRADSFGAPPYPEVVVITSRRTLERRRAAVRAALEAIDAGVAATRADPGAAARDVARAASADVALTRAQLDAVLPVYATGLRLDRDVLRRWAAWDAKVGIVRPAPDVDRLFAFDVSP